MTRPHVSAGLVPDDRWVGSVRQALLKWFARHARPLPWRKDYAPYHVWVAEMMLQQTRMDTVLPYYQRWMERFPTLEAVARAPQQDVLKAWEGLGYYGRARNLHRAAGEMLRRHGGAIPSSLEELAALPGIGPYTAGAVASIAFNQPVPLVDGNVARVLARLTARSATEQDRKDDWALAARLAAGGQARHVNQGMMELGALVCQPRVPQCHACPLADLCQGAALGRPQDFPGVSPRKKIPLVRGAMALLAHQDRLWVRRRPQRGLWGGLWEFPWWEEPEGKNPGPWAELLRQAGQSVPEQADFQPGKLGQINHTLTHCRFRWQCYGWVVTGPRGKHTRPGRRAADPETGAWKTLEELAALPLGKPAHLALALWKEKIQS
ncbi:MAG: A/G-specific adenine glycosylase [Deltaproteobacteria bacterium]|nr:A/G-specific adenine glycosylase [Deltaproteobacteria bacterium]